jgi:WhiB family transcriptional regulator, redox-sensing transcriptional regulator
MTPRRRVRQMAPETRLDAEGWRHYAACSELDPSLFFPAGTSDQVEHRTEAAKRICAAGPVRRACLSFAMATNQRYGVWGGHDAVTRRSLRLVGKVAPDTSDRSGQPQRHYRHPVPETPHSG